MRIKLTADADRALGVIVDQVVKQNPYIERENGSLISAVIVTFQRYLQPRQLEELVHALTTPETARLALIREVEGLSQGMDAEALRGLDSVLRKFRAQAGGARASKNPDEKAG